MKIKIKKEVVLPVLAQIQGILEKRSTLPVFANILISAKDKIQIYASDSELSFSADFPGNIQNQGSLVVDGKKLYEIVKELSDKEIELSSTGKHQVQLRQNKSLFKIHGLNPEDFPKFPPLKNKKMQDVLVEDLMKVIEQTLYCVSLDESRYHLTGVFLEQLSSSYRFVATDGHRMSFIDIDGENNEELKEGIIIPKKGLQEVKKMLAQANEGESFELCVEKPRLLVKYKHQTLSIRLIEGQYPDYKKLLPNYKGNEIIVSTQDLFASLKRIAVLTSARFKGVNFTFENKRLLIQFSHPDVGEASEELPCEHKGEKLKIRFNSKYILDILNSIHLEKLKITLKDSQSPCLIQAVGKDSATCLVMPMKL